MSQFGTNNSKYNDLIELKWTLLTGQEDIDENFYGPSKRSLSANSSGIVESLNENLLEKFSAYSTLTTTTSSHLSSFTEGIDLVVNQTGGLSSLNQTAKNELEIYYFYKVFINYYLLIIIF